MSVTNRPPSWFTVPLSVLGLGCVSALVSASGDIVPVVTASESLVASDGAPYDALGTSVALEGDSLFVGARGADGDATNEGAVYFFSWDAVLGDWAQTQKLTASGAQAFDETGTSLSISGIRLAVGAPRADLAGEDDAGRVILYTFNGASWVESATIEAPVAQAEARFGEVVSISGTTLAVGAAWHDHDGGVRNEGEVHLYTFDDDSVSWSLEATLQAPDAGENDRFGSSLVLQDDLLVVGVAADDDAGIDAGAVWVYRRVDGVWTPETKLLGDDGEWFSGFSCALALSDDGEYLAVGADRSDRAGVDDGAVMVYLASDDTWIQVGALVAPDEPAGRELGSSLAFDGNRVVAGMPIYDQPGDDAGAVVTFIMEPTGAWSTEIIVQADGASTLELCGAAVAADAGRVVAGRPLAGGNNDWRGGVVVLDLTADCDSDGRSDVVAIAYGDAADCDDNGVLDSCDIAEGTSEDVDENGIPDVCFFDCDGNGLNDEDELADGTASDNNGNGTIDACECIADISGDGAVNGADMALLLGSWGIPPKTLPQADLNGDGVVNGADLATLLAEWGACF